LTVVILIGYRYDITLWDWIKLLIVPAVIAGVGLWFNRQQRERELEIAERRTQDEALQAYLDQIGQLLLVTNRPLRRSKQYAAARTQARAQTLTVLTRLNGVRKGSVVQFLYEAALLRKEGLVVDLIGANLREADLSGRALIRANLVGTELIDANLHGADLGEAELSHAHLHNAKLIDANLIGADLTLADLSSAQLNEAGLRRADLSYANLSNANLVGADLSNANLVGADLIEADLTLANLSGATLLEADLSRANLGKANLGKANLVGTVLSKTNLTKRLRQ